MEPRDVAPGSDVESLTLAVSRAEYESRAWREDADQARREVSVHRRAAELVRGMDSLPRTVSDVLRAIELLHGDTMVVTDKARISARETSFSDVHAAWECLHALATVVPRLAFAQDVKVGNLPDRFRHETGGIELTMTEGRQTKRDSRMGRLRKAEFDGKTWDVSPHVKWGNDFRIHFAVDRLGKRVIVGHCGDHLDTAGTRRRH